MREKEGKNSSTGKKEKVKKTPLSTHTYSILEFLCVPSIALVKSREREREERKGKKKKFSPWNLDALERKWTSESFGYFYTYSYIYLLLNMHL